MKCHPQGAPAAALEIVSPVKSVVVDVEKAAAGGMGSGGLRPEDGMREGQLFTTFQLCAWLAVGGMAMLGSSVIVSVR